MRIAVYLPLLCSLLFAAGGSRLAIRYLQPVAGMWTVTIGAGLSALASAWSLALLAGTLLDEVIPDVSGRTFADPVNDSVASAAVLILLFGLLHLAYNVVSRMRLYHKLRQPCARSRGQVIVLADPLPRAFAVPGGGSGGHVVVSQGMLAALTPAERRVLFAHERAHLRGGHHWHSGIVSAAAALNPLLIPLRSAGTHLCERAADEAAAAEVGDRGLAASSLARAALAAASAPCAAPALGYHHAGVGARVVALQNAPSRRRPYLVVVLLGVVAFAMAADIEATHDFLTLVFSALGG
jgi:Zn-dependent protease with chaperone function